MPSPRSHPGRARRRSSPAYARPGWLPSPGVSSRTFREVQAAGEGRRVTGDGDVRLALAARAGEDARAREAVDLPAALTDRAGISRTDVHELPDDEHSAVQPDPADGGIRPASRATRVDRAILRDRD